MRVETTVWEYFTKLEHTLFSWRFPFKDYWRTNCPGSREWSVQQLFDLKTQVWSQLKIARQEIQLPYHYIQFKIAKFSGSDWGFFSLCNCFVDPVVSWFIESWKRWFSYFPVVRLFFSDWANQISRITNDFKMAVIRGNWFAMSWSFYGYYKTYKFLMQL